MAGEAFFVPGSTERSWNATTPSTRILVRQDLYQQVNSFPLHNTSSHHATWRLTCQAPRHGYMPVGRPSA